MQICCAGEVMLELVATGEPGQYARGIAGDSYNTAVYLAREGVDVSYLTRLGDDSLSADIIASLEAEGISTQGVTLCPGRTPGLYLIENDASGERHFTYWRDSSPARELFDSHAQVLPCNAFYFTGITLAVTRSGFANLLALLQTLRQQGTQILFDPNYRPRLWQDADQARQLYRQVIPLCDVVLPTLCDERELWGVDTASECLAFYQDLQVSEIVVKGDELTTLAFSPEETVELQAQNVSAIDTTGAGDAYNAGYLAARLTGANLHTAVECAQQLAARVIQHRGAILPKNQPKPQRN